MSTITYFLIMLPLFSFFLLTILRKKNLIKFIHFFGIIGLVTSFLLCLYLTLQFSINPSVEYINFKINYWSNFIPTDPFYNLLIDKISLLMINIITGIGLLIYIYSIWYMKDQENKFLYFSYINFFISGMLLLVLSNNLLIMYIGWEIVGLFSFLLIGFYNKKRKNGISAIKTFLITYISDIFLLLAIIFSYSIFHTMNFELINVKSVHFHNWSSNNIVILHLILLFFLIASTGKSAQIPLHIWLSKAMVGPTPISALIHAATMVTAGVYLIFRTRALFLLFPKMLIIASIIGSFTLIISGICALLENDIKKILAYSTISQLGYMFLSVGAQCWSATFYHLLTHAFFKALLFLSSGTIIKTHNQEKNIFKIGKSNKKSLFLYFSFLLGSSSLAAIPLLTSGFYSKENILKNLFQTGHTWLMQLGIIGVFITSLYTFRMFFILFHRNKNTLFAKNIFQPYRDIPILLLMLCSTLLGKFIIPDLTYLNCFPPISYKNQFVLEMTSSITCLSGMLTAYVLWGKNNVAISNFLNSNTFNTILQIYNSKIGFESMYTSLLKKPFYFISFLLKHDPLTVIFDFPEKIIKNVNILLLSISSGYIRLYITIMIALITCFIITYNFLCNL